MSAESSFNLSEYEELESKFHDYEYPKVSVVIPTLDCAEVIALTIESVLSQDYPTFEVLFIDGGSKDRTLDAIKNYSDERIHLYSVSTSSLYAMLNKGISQSTGVYLTFLFPGDYYLYSATLKAMMALALEHERPPLVYCGTLLRDGRSEAKILYRPLTHRLLKRGKQPTSLQSCWFHVDTFKEIGKFDTDFTLRGAFEFLCRFSVSKGLKCVSMHRVLTDYNLRWISKKMIIVHFRETLTILYRYFGVFAALNWMLFYQKDWGRLVKQWIRSVRIALLGR